MSASISPIFRDQLDRLRLLPLDDEQPTGLFFVADKSRLPRIRIALEQAERYEADAVFFRLFPDDENRSPLPQVYIYSDTTLLLNESRYAEIHRRLWNAGVVPLVFIFTAAEVKVLNCRREPDIDPDTKRPVLSPFSALENLVKAQQAFVARSIATGTLWEDPAFKTDFALERTAYHKLLVHLKAFREKLTKGKVVSEAMANRLLVMAILIKYLDDRRDGQGNRVFQKGFFKQFSSSGTDDFPSLFLEQGSCIKLFDNLGEHFNGGIFELKENEKEELERADLTPVSAFLKGDQEPTGQLLFWPLYSFQDLPVELISNIYEEFLAKQGAEYDKGGADTGEAKGVVYTPPMLVDFLLDQSLPLHPKTLEWKILDPACGSGIFLVGAYKRLIHCWRMANGWESPRLGDLQAIMRNSIFGCDKEAEAVLVAAFSLCVALCDHLDPVVIWKELKFDDLRIRNLQARDYFEIVDSGEFDNYFDLVIGNPPFCSVTSGAARRVDAGMVKHRPSLPDKQLALLFFEQSFRLCREAGRICLIQPAGPLLYNGEAQSFRDYLFNKFRPDCIFDFTALEGALFSKAKVASAAILASNSPASTDKVLHITFRRTRSIKEKLLFELDPYDFHWIAHDSISRNLYAWKANLLGGGRLHRMLERLITDFPTLGEYLKQKRANEGWQFGEGYSIGCGRKLNAAPNAKELMELSPAVRKELFKLKRTPHVAPWITDKLNVPPAALTQKGIDRSKVAPCKALFFEEPRTGIRSIFRPPHVLIREVIDGLAIPALLSSEESVFSKQIIGVHASPEDKDKLRDLAHRLNDSRVYGILATLMSSRVLVGRASSLLQSDILALPYDENAQDFDFSFWEKILLEDIADYLIEFRRKGEESSTLHEANDSDLDRFGETYCHVLNSLYGKFHPLKPLEFGSFICFPFCYGDSPELELPEATEVTPFLEQLLQRKLGTRLFVNRILRVYEQNVVFMIKPSQKRYWLRSIALRDADETLIDLLEQGY